MHARRDFAEAIEGVLALSREVVEQVVWELFRSIDRHGRMSDRRLTDHSVAVVVKRAAKKAGLSAALFSGHSLRAGFVTEAKKNGADDAAIMDQTGHKSLAMVQRYHRRTKKWERPASARLGL